MIFVCSCDSFSPVDPLRRRINLRKATKLREVELTYWLGPQWILATLKTVTRNHGKLQWITLGTFSSGTIKDDEKFRSTTGETKYQERLGLDLLMAQLRESQSIRLRVLPESGWRSRSKMLLQELMTGGVVDLVYCVDSGFQE